MFKAKNKASYNGYGVARIVRNSYNTQNGFSVKSGWWTIRAAVIKRDKGFCVPCFRKKLVVKAVEVHHLIPLSRGGTTTMANLISLCKVCHDARHNHLARSR
jgi:5-methylcytosine-specific restriction endonuclease McrA